MKVSGGRLFALFISFLTLALLQNCTGAKSQNSVQQEEEVPVSNEPPTLTRVDFMTGLNNPWDLAFTPDGMMLFTERCNGLSVRKRDGSVVRLFGTAGSSVVAADLFCEGQSGMHGVAVDPDFTNNRTIFIFMASNMLTPRTNRLVRLVVDSGYTTVSNRVDIITNLAYKDAGNTWGGAGSHSGGRIRFGADGFLYITTGDNHNGTIPQSPTVLGGKVLRVDRNGNAAPGNNPPAGFDSRVFTYGHRNVQGITFRPGTSEAFISEHGPGHSDEVTKLVAGGNGGWDPVPDAGVSCADNYCGYVSNKANGALTSMTDLEKFPNAMRPVWNNSGVSQGMGPSTFLVGNQWKGWRNKMLVGIMGNKRLELLTIDNNNTLVSNETVMNLPASRIRSLVNGPDGSLYVSIDEGSIWKITPQ